MTAYLIWGAMLIPVVVLGAAKLIWRRQVTGLEILGAVAFVCLCVLLSKVGVETVLTSDTEYWGGWATKITYVEEWDEYVRQTCTRTHRRPDGSTYTSTYDCSYVDNHPPRWMMYGSNGEEISIDSYYYNELKAKWGGERFIEMNRKFHSIDGDAYEVNFTGDDAAMIPITTEHSYVNRVQASSAVYRPRTLTDEERAQYDLYEYPEPDEYARCPSVLGGGDGGGEARRYLEVMNAKLGSARKLRMWLLVFPDQPIEAAMAQEAHWSRGNKNELILCVGTNPTSPEQGFAWAYVISWTENETTRVQLRNDVMALKDQHLALAAGCLVSNAMASWVKPDFDKFSYLTVEPPLLTVVLIYVGAFLLSLGVAWVAVVNQVDVPSSGPASAGRDLRSYDGRFPPPRASPLPPNKQG